MPILEVFEPVFFLREFDYWLPLNSLRSVKSSAIQPIFYKILSVILHLTKKNTKSISAVAPNSFYSLQRDTQPILPILLTDALPPPNSFDHCKFVELKEARPPIPFISGSCLFQKMSSPNEFLIGQPTKIEIVICYRYVIF